MNAATLASFVNNLKEEDFKKEKENVGEDEDSVTGDQQVRKRVRSSPSASQITDDKGKKKKRFFVETLDLGDSGEDEFGGEEEAIDSENDCSGSDTVLEDGQEQSNESRAANIARNIGYQLRSSARLSK